MTVDDDFFDFGSSSSSSDDDDETDLASLKEEEEGGMQGEGGGRAIVYTHSLFPHRLIGKAPSLPPMAHWRGQIMAGKEGGGGNVFSQQKAHPHSIPFFP